MNLEVKPEDACRILKDVRELIRSVILPRISQLEEEVRMLRRVTWPVCQSLKEQSQISDISNKRKLLQMLDPDEVKFLLIEKVVVSGHELSYSTQHLLNEENTYLSLGPEMCTRESTQ